jgi:hypothetical protein
MGVPFDVAHRLLHDAAQTLFANDSRVQALGITSHESQFGYEVIRNARKVVPLAAISGPMPHEIKGIPLLVRDRFADPSPLLKLPASGPGSPTAASLVPEQGRHRPLVCGLQIQNYDDDIRQGVVANGYIIIGTLGCFVRLAGGQAAILSNNHVLAGENRGIRGADRIAQPGTGSLAAGDQVAELTDFTSLATSPFGATPAAGNVNYNVIDAAVATVLPGEAFHQRYLSSRSLPAPTGHARAAVNDRVFKVGRTTGLTRGTIRSVSTIVGPVPYAPGPCWFERSLLIEGDHGTMFSDHGDSGSAIVKEATGEVVGVLYAGNGVDTYACPIEEVLTAFSCQIW